MPPLWVPEARQWLSTTSSRIAGDGYSWMQAVHWVAGSGLYTPRRRTGPRTIDHTTLRIAQLCAELSPCRPGIDYLVRRSGLSERTVKYHLSMLREAGLLAYVERGTRVQGAAARASEFALVVPPQFDQALGIRTVGEGPQRRMTGIEETGRGLMRKLAKRATRKVRKPRTSTKKSKARHTRDTGTRAPATAGKTDAAAVPEGSRCTPMRGGCCSSSTAGSTWFPPENKLASGASKSPTPKKPKSTAGGRRRPNRVGRRFQLAAELVAQVPWLRGEAVPRVAWVVRHLADAGWTAIEVQAWLETTPAPDRGTRRPAGLLAYRIRGVDQHVTTAAQRTSLVERWEAAREAARRFRIRQVRAQQEHAEGGWQAPIGRAAQREVGTYFATVTRRPIQPIPDTDDPGWQEALDGLASMSPAERVGLIKQAWGEWMVGETTLVTGLLNTLGRAVAEELFGAELVTRVIQFESGGAHRRLARQGHR